VRAVLPLLLLPAVAVARPANVCIDVDIKVTPTDQLQIAGWVEDAQGNFVDTVYLTSKTGRYGIGNRPGRFDFNSGSPMHDNWPYGRRITTFPVWAHRHGKTWPEIVFQDGQDSDLSHGVGLSSHEDMPVFCAPHLPSDHEKFDAATCASPAYTDKGIFSAQTSLYPPRSDLMVQPGDSPSVAMYKMMNPFDAITAATPVGGQLADLHWAAPPTIDYGDYVLFLEVSKEYDFNSTYNQSAFPSPKNIPYGDYGLPYRGQPSVVYSVPFKIAPNPQSATATDYVGYGDANGSNGTLNPPDSTITTDTPGSGASRLELFVDHGQMVRVRLDMLPGVAGEPPAAPADITATEVAATTATIAFTEPAAGDLVTGYDIKIRALDDITLDNFDQSMPVTAAVHPAGAGAQQTFQLTGLLPNTTYSVGIRGRDGCFQMGGLATAKLTTGPALGGEVDACFVATAAYGSLMANDVEVLRRARDMYLSSNVVGELAVEAYYTFGPALASVIAPSELLRETARAMLAPVVSTIRLHRF
jgi:hypothetical protein